MTIQREKVQNRLINSMAGVFREDQYEAGKKFLEDLDEVQFWQLIEVIQSKSAGEETSLKEFYNISEKLRNQRQGVMNMSETKKRFYIAYGSNLSVEQMRGRTPDAKIVGTGILYGWRLLFKVHATVEPCEGKNTPVLVWEISERDEERLDRYEGYPSYYYKQDAELEVFPIEGGEPVMLTAMVYLMTEGRCLRHLTPAITESWKRGTDGSIFLSTSWSRRLPTASAGRTPSGCLEKNAHW